LLYMCLSCNILARVIAQQVHVAGVAATSQARLHCIHQAIQTSSCMATKLKHRFSGSLITCFVHLSLHAHWALRWCLCTAVEHVVQCAEYNSFPILQLAVACGYNVQAKQSRADSTGLKDALGAAPTCHTPLPPCCQPVEHTCDAVHVRRVRHLQGCSVSECWYRDITHTVDQYQYDLGR